MKALVSLFMLTFINGAAHAMPCDAGYFCVSKSKKYKVELQRCRYRNHINLITFKVNNVEIPGASLKAGWDADQVLAFEVDIPTADDGAVKILSAEIPKPSLRGLLKIKEAESEPGPLKTTFSERITCTKED